MYTIFLFLIVLPLNVLKRGGEARKLSKLLDQSKAFRACLPRTKEGVKDVSSTTHHVHHTDYVAKYTLVTHDWSFVYPTGHEQFLQRVAFMVNITTLIIRVRFWNPNCLRSILYGPQLICVLHVWCERKFRSKVRLLIEQCALVNLRTMQETTVENKLLCWLQKERYCINKVDIVF